MSAIVVTGAAGLIGRKIMPHLRAAGHRVEGLDLVPGGDPTIVAADLAVWDMAWVDRLNGADAVVHLAADPWPNAGWERIERLNLDLTLNLFQAASLAGVRRVVFASTNWVVAGHRFAEGPLTPGMPPAPVNAYGASKLFGERLGRSFSQSRGLSVICLRIGAAQMHEGQMPDADTPMGDWARQMWLSDRDLCNGVRLAVEAPPDLSFAVVNLMSDNPGMRWDLGPTRDLLGYTPQDSFAAPAGGYRRRAELARSVLATIGALDAFFHDAEL